MLVSIKTRTTHVVLRFWEDSNKKKRKEKNKINIQTQQNKIEVKIQQY